jgi:hypothetical protein
MLSTSVGNYMIDDIDFGFLLVVGMVAVSLGGLVWWMLNGQSGR